VLEAALWGLVGGLALVIGAVAALTLRPSPRSVAFVMAFGAGVLISAVDYDLTQEAFDLGGGDSVAAGLAGGSIVYAALYKLVNRRRSTGAEAEGRALALGALLDGIPESAAIGLTLLAGGGVSVSFLVAVFLSNLPESISASYDFEQAHRSPGRIVAIWLVIAAAGALAAAVGYQILGGSSADLQAATKAFAGGAILTMLATEMVPDAFRESGNSIAVGLVTVLGFALAALLTSA
jgi:ZIP family zinc transporter